MVNMNEDCQFLKDLDAGNEGKKHMELSPPESIDGGEALDFNPSKSKYTWNLDPEWYGGSDQSLDEDFLYAWHTAKSIAGNMQSGLVGMYTNEIINERGEDYKANNKSIFNEALKNINDLMLPHVTALTWDKEKGLEIDKSKVLQVASPGIWKALNVLKGIAKTGVSTKSNEELINYAEGMRKEIKKKLDKEANSGVLKGYQDWVANEPMSFQKFVNDIDYFHRGVATLLPSIAGAAMGSLSAGPGGGMAMMFGMDSGSEYNEAMSYMVDEMGMDPKEAMPIATATATTYGFVSGAIEYWGFSSMMKYLGVQKQGGKLLSRRLVDSLLKNKNRGKLTRGTVLSAQFLVEDLKQGIQEGMQNMAQLVIAKTYKDYGAGSEKGYDIDTALRNLHTDIAEAAMDESTWQAGATAMAGTAGGIVTVPYKARQRNWVEISPDPETGSPVINENNQEDYTDEDAILLSIMPPGTELDNLQRQADMVDNAKNNLEIETAEDVKKQIDLTLSQGGRKRLEDKGIDVDKFISRYDELFGGDITTILDEADKVIQGTEEIDKIVDESDSPFDNNNLDADINKARQNAEINNQRDISSDNNNDVDGNQAPGLIDDDAGFIDATEDADAQELKPNLDTLDKAAGLDTSSKGVGGFDIQTQTDTSVPENTVYEGLPEDTKITKGWSVKKVKSKNSDGQDLLREVQGKDVSIDGSNRPFFIIKSEGTSPYVVVDSRTGIMVSTGNHKTQKDAINNAENNIKENPELFKKNIIAAEKSNFENFIKPRKKDIVDQNKDDVSEQELNQVVNEIDLNKQKKKGQKNQKLDKKFKVTTPINIQANEQTNPEFQEPEFKPIDEDSGDATNLGSLLEDLQTIAWGEKIKENRELADEIVGRLKLQYPEIKGQELGKVFDRHGKEVAGKALGMGAQWSGEKGGLDTPPHEYAHIYLDILSASGNKVINDAISAFAGEGMNSHDAKEHLATEMGKYYSDTIQDKSFWGKIDRFLKKFWLETKKYFKPLASKEFQDLISMRFYDGKNANQIRDGGAQTEQLQVIKEGSLAEAEGFNIFTKIWDQTNIKAKKLGGRFQEGKASIVDFNAQMIQQIPQKYHTLYRDWVKTKFAGDKFIQWLRSAVGNPDNFLASEELADIMKDDFVEVNEGLANINMDNNNIDLKGVGRLSLRTFNELGVIASDQQTKDLFKAAIFSETYEDFKANKVKNIINVSDTVLKEKDRQLKQYYVAQNNKVLTNQPDGIGNQRINLTLNKNSGFMQIKGPESIITKKNNAAYERKMLAEWDQKLDSKGGNAVQLAWLSGEDLYTMGPKNKPQETYEFLEEDDLYNMQKNLSGVGSYGAVPAFNRGDSKKMAFALITESQFNRGMDKASSRNYWTKILERQLITPEQANNFMGYNLTAEDLKKLGIKTEKDLGFFRAQEIARFEAIEAYMPGMIKEGDGAKLLKRIKIPFTPVVRSEEMEDAEVLFVDPTNLQFVKDGRATNATHEVPDIGAKYIGDGGTPTSRTFFNKMNASLGLKEGVNTAKTVMYENNNEGKKSNLGAFKHQHYAPTKNLEIWENYGKPGQKLVAKIDGNGDIKDVNGKYYDMLLTKDEAKISTGDFNVDPGSSFNLKGTSIGLIKYGEKAHSTAKHPMQWYNYIRDPEVRRKFKDIMLPRAQKKIQEAWDLIKDDALPAEEKILEVLKKLEGEYPEGLAHTLVEKARLGAGQTPDMEAMLNTIIQTGVLEKGLQLGNNPGTMADLAPNLAGDLNEGEISIGESDADFIFKRYKEETGSKATIYNVNQWLKGRALQVLVSRSPIPYDGGATMMTVKRIHSRGGIAEMHANEIYRRFEGDNDGDKVQIELLPDDMVGVYQRVSKNMGLAGIKVSYHMKIRDAKFDMSKRSDFYALSGALTYGSNAIGEIANVQATFGQLQEIFESATIDNEVITIRDPDSMIKGKISMNDYLRVLLQAAVDNAEHLALKDANYNMEQIRRALFKVDRGKGNKTGITDRQWEVLQPLVTQHTMPNQFRRGRRPDRTKHRFDSTIDASKGYLNYVQNRYETIDNLVKAKRKKKEAAGELDVVGETNPGWIKFNRNTHVAEDIAILPAIIDAKERQDNPKLYANRETPFRIPYPTQLKFHSTSLSNLENKFRAIVGQMRKEKNFKEDINKGYQYVRSMGSEYFTKLVREFQALGPQSFEKNEKMLDFVEKHGKHFESLSKTARVAATIKFLEGFEKIALDSGLNLENKLNSASFPPYGKSKGMYTLLDPQVMQAYNHEYNKLMKGKSKATDVRFKGFDTIIQEVCKS